MNKKICAMVTDRIVAEMEKGEIPWRKPWTGTSDGAISHTTGRPYSFLNQVLLGAPGEYITFKQATAEGGKIKHGEHGLPVVFWKQVAVDDVDKSNNPVKKNVPMLRYYTVFRIDQCEGIKPKYEAKAAKPAEPIKAAEDIITKYQTKTGLKIIRDKPSKDAFYSPARDYIQVPEPKQYKRQEEFYGTLFHEITHSTGHSSRLKRFTGTAAAAAFGSQEYSKEELIAEIGAAALINKCGIERKASFKNSAAYIQSWIKALKKDKTMLIAAAGKAEKAVEYIMAE